jgi:hypothetical protein
MLAEVLLQIETVHTLHSHIENDAAYTVEGCLAEELSGRGEYFDLITG